VSFVSFVVKPSFHLVAALPRWAFRALLRGLTDCRKMLTTADSAPKLGLLDSQRADE